jgi:hypothetical protein
MRKIELSVIFSDEDGQARTETSSVETVTAPDPGGEHRLVQILLSEMKVMVGDQPDLKHNATALNWLKFPNRPSNIEQFHDIRNSQALWFELTNLILGAEGDLALAQMYKALEPPAEPSFDDDMAVNDLHYLHERKMTLLNEAVRSLVKVQDLVNRLLHESLGGNLVDATKPNWERSQVTRENVEKRLKAKRASGDISQADYEAIAEALAIPNGARQLQVVQNYRNRLMHHVRPSVDYSMFFSSLESRAGEEIKDPQGKVTGRRFLLLARPPVQYSFAELRTAYLDYLDEIVAMLEKLSKIDILRR